MSGLKEARTAFLRRIKDMTDNSPLVRRGLENAAEAALKYVKKRITGEENLNMVADMIRKGKKVIFAGNHQGIFDMEAFVYASDYLNGILGGNYESVVVGAMKFDEGDMGPIGSIASSLAARHHIIWESIPQSVQSVNPDKRVIARETHKLVDRVKAVLKEGKGFMFFPERTRTKDGLLIQPSDTLFKRIFEDESLRDELVVVPISIEGSRDIHRPDSGMKINPFARMKIHYGKPLTYEEIKEEMKLMDNSGLTPAGEEFPKIPCTVTDIVMLHAAEPLSAEFLGFYKGHMDKFLRVRRV